jgi:class 3 adenylate cyclase
MNYTAIGDVVNVAKRLQERAEPGQILIDESVVKCLGDLVIADRIGEMQVKGRRVPAVAYSLRGLT